MPLIGRDSLEALTARLLRPRRPRAREARALLKTIEDPRRAWSALRRAGLVPPHWVGSKERRFLRDPPVWRPWGDDDHTTTPPTVAACLALASDPDGAEAAETLASVVAERLAPWDLDFKRPPRERLDRVLRQFAGVRLPRRVLHPRFLWRCVSPRAWTTCNDYAVRPHEAAHLALGGAAFLKPGDRLDASHWGPSCLPTSLKDRVGSGVARLVEDHIAGARTWNTAAERDSVVPPDSAALRSVLLAFPPALVGRRFAELPDPFEPLLALWATGYALEAIDEHTLVLIAPIAV